MVTWHKTSFRYLCSVVTRVHSRVTGKVKATPSASECRVAPAETAECALEAVAKFRRHHIVQNGIDGRVDVKHDPKKKKS